MNRMAGFFVPTETNALALIIYEKAHVDPVTGQRSLIGLLNTIVVPNVPVVIPRLHVYIEIVPAPGDENGPFLFGVFQVTGENVFKSAVETNGAKPGMVIAQDYLVQNLPLPVAGEYLFQISSADKVLLSRSFFVQISPQSPGAQADSPMS